jgi:general secretion pathway protein D
VADDISNSLIILATARDFEMIKEVLRRLDVVPRQVLIETLIAEIGLTDNLQFGVEYAIANRVGSVLVPRRSSTTTTGGTTTTGERPPRRPPLGERHHWGTTTTTRGTLGTGFSLREHINR